MQTAAVPLSHPHTNSISCMAFNAPYITKDVGGKVQQSLLAVESYDGAIILYNATTGTLVQVLEGPSNVEWVIFYPKGGTVLLAGSIVNPLLLEKINQRLGAILICYCHLISSWVSGTEAGIWFEE